MIISFLLLDVGLWRFVDFLRYDVSYRTGLGVYGVFTLLQWLYAYITDRKLPN